MSNKLKDRLATSSLYLIVFLVVASLIIFFGFIFVQGVPSLSWNFVFGSSNALGQGGIGIQLFNSFYLMLISMIVCIPISIGAGIYLALYAPKGTITNLIKTSIEILSSLPSVVVGLFGMSIFVLKAGFGFSILSGALTLSIFNFPLLTRTVQDSLESVSSSQLEAGLSLGLSRFETVIHVLLPVALPSIVSGMILGAGRAFGEAAALIYTSGQSAPALNFMNFNILDLTSPISPFRPAETLAVHIWKINSEGIMPNVDAMSAGSSIVLIISVLLFNILARVIGNKLFKKITSA